MASIVLLPSSFQTIREYACTSGEAIGDCVSLYGDPPSGGLEVVRRTDITSPPWRRSIGIILTKPTSTTCTVIERGICENVYTGLSVGREYGVQLDGRLGLNLPNYPIGGPQLLMFMGVARASNAFEVAPHALGLRRPS